MRLTDSGLGCPDWPQCYGGRRPATRIARDHRADQPDHHRLPRRRRDRRRRARLLPPSLPAPPGASGRSCRSASSPRRSSAPWSSSTTWRPELVMGHFILSMMLLDAGFALMWCSRYEPWDRRRSWDRKGVWAVRALVPLGQLTILAGTVATGSGPHAGEFEGQQVQRFTFEGAGHARMGCPAPCRPRGDLRLRRDRRLVLPAPAGRRPAGAETAHRRPGPAGHSRESSVTSSGSSNCRPRSSGSTSRWPPELAGDAVDDRRGRTARAARGPAGGGRRDRRVGPGAAGAGAGTA